ncbi:MAG: hypothetical protein Q9M35_02495 [Rhodothermus sp.]|nr:hypothetical protein [Rhodothermus sp.]
MLHFSFARINTSGQPVRRLVLWLVLVILQGGLPVVVGAQCLTWRSTLGGKVNRDSVSVDGSIVVVILQHNVAAVRLVKGYFAVIVGGLD